MSCLQWQACGSRCPNRVKETNPHHASFHADTCMFLGAPKNNHQTWGGLVTLLDTAYFSLLASTSFPKGSWKPACPDTRWSGKSAQAAGGSLFLLPPEFWKRYFKESCNPARQLPLIQQNCCSSRNCYHIAGKRCL